MARATVHLNQYGHDLDFAFNYDYITSEYINGKEYARVVVNYIEVTNNGADEEGCIARLSIGYELDDADLIETALGMYQPSVVYSGRTYRIDELYDEKTGKDVPVSSKPILLVKDNLAHELNVVFTVYYLGDRRITTTTSALLSLNTIRPVYTYSIGRDEDNHVKLTFNFTSGVQGYWVFFNGVRAVTDGVTKSLEVVGFQIESYPFTKEVTIVNYDTTPFECVPFRKWDVSLNMEFNDGSVAIDHTFDADGDKWIATFNVTGDAPNIMQNGKAYMNIEAYNYVTGAFEELPFPSGLDCELTETGFKFNVPLDYKYVSDGLNFASEARIKYSWDSYEYEENADHDAFYRTTRNMNFSNGLANNVFLGGTDAKNYTSRVWYSYVNNPLYFPDMNYIEVGSNDTAVMGLVKIGQYLGIVKQGKTTDTSIFIAYPTSYDNETAYAVKPTTSGIGAYAKYCFNVLGDETLFLSKEGVMAITPRTEGDEVKNRSYFIDGKLLEEPDLKNAYSFVWHGFYMIAVPNEEDNGHIYLLDGNQRNSWGNDKTNLVYECYFWDNVPAKQFVSFKEELWFNDGANLCRFKTDKDERPYNDDGEAIKAEWSTMLDDDGSSHFYKNLQKKGTKLTLLPSEYGSSCGVYIRVDNGVAQFIGEANSDGTDLPIDFYFNKKLKKYKRLQIIVRNEIPDQGFGIDQIVKLYTIGNYSKK